TRTGCTPVRAAWRALTRADPLAGRAHRAADETDLRGARGCHPPGTAIRPWLCAPHRRQTATLDCAYQQGTSQASASPRVLQPIMTIPPPRRFSLALRYSAPRAV